MTLADRSQDSADNSQTRRLRRRIGGHFGARSEAWWNSPDSSEPGWPCVDTDDPALRTTPCGSRTGEVASIRFQPTNSGEPARTNEPCSIAFDPCSHPAASACWWSCRPTEVQANDRVLQQLRSAVVLVAQGRTPSGARLHDFSLTSPPPWSPNNPPEFSSFIAKPSSVSIASSVDAVTGRGERLFSFIFPFLSFRPCAPSLKSSMN